MQPILEISLFGTCAVRVAGPQQIEIRGAKHRALFALLVAAPMGRRPRKQLQRILWGEAEYESGHLNLRRALSDLRKLMGESFDALLHTTSVDVELDLDRVHLVGDLEEGPFLQDLDIRTPGFVEWVTSVRNGPDDLAALGRAARRQASGRLRPRIVALPLADPTGDARLRAWGDWIAVEATRSLSRSNLFAVISPLSARESASRTLGLPQMRELLDVDYLLDGTIRREHGEIVCDFDFVDAQDGTFLWNRNLACEETHLTDELPGRLAGTIRSIGRTVANTAIRHVRETPLPDIATHQLLVAGVSSMHGRGLQDFLASRKYLAEAAKRSPRSSDVHAWLGKWNVLNVFKGYSLDREADARSARESTSRALDLDPDSSFALTIDGFIYGNLLRRLDLADERYSAALDLNPNESLSWLLRGSSFAFRDDGRAAVRATMRARRLSPIDPFGYYYDSLAGTAYFAAGDYAQALELADRSLAVNDKHISTLRLKIGALHGLDRMEEARRTARHLQRHFPNFTLAEYERRHPATDHRIGRLALEALRTAGIT